MPSLPHQNDQMMHEQEQNDEMMYDPNGMNEGLDPNNLDNMMENQLMEEERMRPRGRDLRRGSEAAAEADEGR